MDNRVDFDKFTSSYNNLLNQETRFFSSNEEYFARYKVEIVRQQVSSSVNRLLEYGCGIGRNIPFLQQAFSGAEIVGSDISNASLDVARRDNMGVDFVQECGDVTSMEPFDLIFVAGVFHHVPLELRPQVTRTLFERLSPGGTLFVFEHNPFNPVTRRIVSNCPYDEDAVLLKPSELIKLLVQAGFSVQRKAYCLFVPSKLSLLARLESRLGWLPLGGQYWIQAKRFP
jgi:2-polyprenyl-3-methyl-5-hydroxy-6-metoxy-1,4-benzoquinol methylase